LLQGNYNEHLAAMQGISSRDIRDPSRIPEIGGTDHEYFEIEKTCIPKNRFAFSRLCGRHAKTVVHPLKRHFQHIVGSSGKIGVRIALECTEVSS
jgi:hypothetical protein